jgi:hypothetical protein
MINQKRFTFWTCFFLQNNSILFVVFNGK